MIMVAAETAGVLAGLAEATVAVARATTVVEARPHRRPTAHLRARRAPKFQRAKHML